ncbi:TPR-like protein [Pleurotus eryngii]|uniref:TPR-like protein n=1 Tax=Pleurotus eryngii TaxID=5323 RepID=A0A9P6A1D6_PLEER|nr:TPR-like protein [Pleurotus eryngii]
MALCPKMRQKAWMSQACPIALHLVVTNYFRVLVQCISDSFQVDPSDASQVQKLSVKPATLQSIFNVFLQTKDKVGSGSEEATASTSKTPSTVDKAQAEKFKQEGNSLMSSKKYDEAIDMYTKAVNLDSTNPVYYSNRAAAHSSKGDHLSAVGDAEKAIEVDPKFTKAYHRLG